MKHFTLGQLLVGASLLGGFLSATATPTVTPLKGKAQDVSPYGLTVVGFYDQEWNEDWTIWFHESFVWDGVNGQQWKTSYDGMRLPANGGGGFKPGHDGDVKVTREGNDIIISGDFKRATLIDNMAGKRVISTSASGISTATLPAGVYGCGSFMASVPFLFAWI